MPVVGKESPGEPKKLLIPFERVAKFVRQLSHDVRNNLGSMDLQSAYIAELVTDPEVAAELKKLRAMVTSSAKALQTTTSRFWIPQANLLTLSAQIVVEDFRERLGKVLPAAGSLEWTVELGPEFVSVDIEMLYAALSEFFRNAVHFHEGPEPITVKINGHQEQLVLEIGQKKKVLDSAPESWGRDPLLSTRRGGYGLGLYHARQILETLGGDISFVHDPEKSELSSRITLPFVPESDNGR